jgi:hypothetical protein
VGFGRAAAGSALRIAEALGSPIVNRQSSINNQQCPNAAFLALHKSDEEDILSRA